MSITAYCQFSEKERLKPEVGIVPTGSRNRSIRKSKSFQTDIGIVPTGSRNGTDRNSVWCRPEVEIIPTGSRNGADRKYSRYKMSYPSSGIVSSTKLGFAL